MRTLLVLLVLASASLVSAQTTLRPRVPDLTPGDGFLEPGTRQNPYVGTDAAGNTLRMRERVPDLNPGDGFMERGSRENPYVLEED